MPVLGDGGRLVLKREAPYPCIVASNDLLDWDTNQILDITDGYLSGDRVQAVGLPIYVDGVPIKPAGWGMYWESHWYIGPERWQCSHEDDYFYKNSGEEFPNGQFGNDSKFYATPGDRFGTDMVPEDPENDYFIHVNGLGYASFYTTRCEALRGCASDRVDLAPVGLPMIIGPYGSATYNNAVAECLPEWGDYRMSNIVQHDDGVSICLDAPLFEHPTVGTEDYHNANLSERKSSATKGYIWEVVCGVREWSLDLDAPAVDTTGVSEKFGENIKSLVTGGGSIEFYIDRECMPEGQTNGIPLMELLLLTDKGCKATAEFWMMTGSDCKTPADCGRRIEGSLYYESDVLITQTSVNLRPLEMVAGVANFVTTGEIKLMQEPWASPRVCDTTQRDPAPLPVPVKALPLFDREFVEQQYKQLDSSQYDLVKPLINAMDRWEQIFGFKEGAWETGRHQYPNWRGVRIKLQTEDPAGVWCRGENRINWTPEDFGQQATLITEVTLNWGENFNLGIDLNQYPGFIEYIWVHELGHALGMTHAGTRMFYQKPVPAYWSPAATLEDPFLRADGFDLVKDGWLQATGQRTDQVPLLAASGKYQNSGQGLAHWSGADVIVDGTRYVGLNTDVMSYETKEYYGANIIGEVTHALIKAQGNFIEKRGPEGNSVDDYGVLLRRDQLPNRLRAKPPEMPTCVPPSEQG